jgi:flagellar hook-associated protein 3 FlgL
VSEGGTFGAGPNGYYDYTDPDRFEITFDYVGKPEDIYGEPVVNTGEVLREIEDGIVMPVNIAGDELLTDPATGYNALHTMIEFNQNLLQGDSRRIETSIEKIDVVSRRMLAAQTKNGARVNRFETTLERNEMKLTETTRLQSELEDAELAETISDFSLLETVYNAALKSAARSLQPSLANFL